MKNQKGMVVLMTTIVLGSLMTMILISASQVGVMDIRIVANTLRHNQAIHAASAGMEYGIDKVNQDLVQNNILEDATYKFTDTVAISTGSYAVKAARLDPLKDDLIRITSYGYTDDNTSGRPNSVNTAVVRKIPVLGYTPLPIIGKNSIYMGFNTKVINHTGTLDTMWTGGTITFSNYVWDITNPDGTVSNDMGMYVDDENFNNVDGDRFFENFFSVTKDYVRSIGTIIDCPWGCTENVLDGLHGIVWIDGDLDLGTTALGTVDDPILLIVTGDVKFSSGYTNIYGLIYGNTIVSTSNVTDIMVYGGIIAEDYISLDGQIYIVYNTSILEILAAKYSKYAMVAGSWTDME